MSAELGFPLWLRLTHFFNFLLITLLVRSGFQILADHPRLYWNDYCEPGTEWLRFTRKRVPRDKLYTSKDDSVPISPWLGLPGGLHSLGAGRHWHFFSAFFWLLNGIIYLVCLFSTEQWPRLLPTSPEIFPKAWKVALTYMHLQLPPPEVTHPYNALQQLAYAFVVFIMSPLIIVTGLLQSPAIAGRFPWSVRLVGGHQPARSLHFILAVGFVLFTAIHVFLVLIERFPRNMLLIVLGQEQGDATFAIGLGIAAVILVIALNVFLVWWTRRFPRAVQHFTGGIVNPLVMKPLRILKSRQAYSKSRLGHYFWVNGYPPQTKEWRDLADNRFKDYRLSIGGLVEKPVSLSLSQLKTMKKEINLTEHICIQGWSGFAEWGGVPLSEIIRLCQPKPSARWIIFHSFQYDKNGVEYYTSLSMEEAMYPQTILAYEMNGKPLPLKHGAPLRLRMESMLGFKMCKWIKSIEFVEKLSEVGLGHGGYREDMEYYSNWARI
jgi:sulfoxide reductase catalytic subunit YedY